MNILLLLLLLLLLLFPICCHQVAVSRSSHQFPNDHDSAGSNKPSKEDRAKLLLDWALDDFKPEGPEAFETIKGGFASVNLLNKDTIG